MLPRVLLELFLVLLPFAAFGAYRIAAADAAVEGRKEWPMTALFVTGVGLAVLAWLFLILREDRSENCNQPAYRDAETGELVPARSYECDVSLDEVGVPRSDDPGGRTDTPE